jgi:para-aminobenzoate synthetase/4-amino-4-deoxychorismate lyase
MLVYAGFENKSFLFDSPKEIISCNTHARLKESFAKMEYFLDMGFFLAGFVSYEAGYGFEDKLFQDKIYSFPLVHIGCYEKPSDANGFTRIRGDAFKIRNIKPLLSFEAYEKDITRIREYISEGDVYQITYCLKMKFEFEGDAPSLFFKLLREQPVPYPAYIDSGDYKILSLSPELFMKKKGRNVTTKPMKGTWHRGGNMFSDVLARFRLKYDEKNRAENVMIADLLRNDLGRIGTNVRTPRLFEVSGYTTLFQMTSTVTAQIADKIPVNELFKAIFPSGSVTGAPKMRAMEIIRELEKEERKIYTGAIGFITPSRELCFNVPIRTLLLSGNNGEMGIGGGIIWDSTPQGEWDECTLKAKFLTGLER